jgi:hypothetical protein
LGTTEIDTFIKIMGKSRIDHMRSQDIRHECGIQEIEEWVNTQRTEWSNYVSLMALNQTV